MRLDIWSDAVCPWCFIGKRRLDEVMAARGMARSQLRWFPFQLYPQIPAGGIDRKAFMRARFGPDGPRRGAIYDTMRAEGEQLGIEFDFESIAVMPNTFDAHRLTEFACEGPREAFTNPELDPAERQHALVDALFDAYFCNGEDIGDHAVLTRIATRCGMQPAVVTGLLRGNALVESTHQALAAAREGGVEGVPFLVINEQVPLQGAQSAEVFNHYLDRCEQLIREGRMPRAGLPGTTGP